MKKIFAIMMAAAVAVGCHNDNIAEDVPATPESYCDKLTLNVGEETTRAFDSELVWSWESTDKIIGYQNEGGKSRNTLNFVSDNEFACDAFTYSTTNAADFHFFYAKEETEGALTAVQDGTWRPVLVGTAASTTLQNIESVNMTHLSAALEFNLYEVDKTTPRNIISASLTSASDFVGCWTVQDDLTYEQTLSGTTIEINNVNKPTVVFNMPTGDFAADALTLTLTTTSGITITKELPAQTFVAGKRNKYNVAVPEPAYLPTGADFRSAINFLQGDSNYTGIKFYANSETTSAKQITPASGTQPIYMVTNGSTLEIHTPAPEFMANANCSSMLNALVHITYIDFNNCVNTSNTTTMFGMFQSCSALETLNLSSFNTENVTNMSNMFSDCTALTFLNLTSFNTEKVTTMNEMFKGCNALSSITLNFNAPEVIDTNSMFRDCSSLTSLNLSSFNSTKLGDMDYMFDGCSKLETLNLGGTFNTAKTTSMIYAFADCSSLKTLDLSSFNTEKVQYMNNMFSGCSSLTSIDLSSFNTSIVRNMKSMFSGCAKLNTLDLTSFKFWNKANLPNTENMLNGLNSEGEIYDLYVTQAGYDFLTGKADYGTGNFTLKVK